MKRKQPTKRYIAYHEAGHVVALAFTSDAWMIAGATIRANSYSVGRVCLEKVEDRLPDLPPRSQRRIGRARLLYCLAGRGAIARIAAPKDRVAILDPYSEEWDWEKTDLFEAKRIAEVIARPGMPVRRILAQTEKWTIEMLALPDVWHRVETLAGMLYGRGTLTAKEILAVCESITPAESLPKWRRRLGIGHALPDTPYRGHMEALYFFWGGYV